MFHKLNKYKLSFIHLKSTMYLHSSFHCYLRHNRMVGKWHEANLIYFIIIKIPCLVELDQYQMSKSYQKSDIYSTKGGCQTCQTFATYPQGNPKLTYWKTQESKSTMALERDWQIFSNPKISRWPKFGSVSLWLLAWICYINKRNHSAPSLL